jgi:tripartite-type tricarboxylate transporter receptor subunit TctC
MGEAGTELNGSTTHGVYAPAGIAQDLVARLNREIVRIMQTPELRGVLVALGADLLTGSAAEFAERQRLDRESYGVLVREAGIRAE